MSPRPVLFRAGVSSALLLAAFSLLALPKAKEPAPRFNATTITSEKFNNASIPEDSDSN